MSERPVKVTGFQVALLLTLGLGVVALGQPSEVITSAVATLTVVLLLCAILAARFGSERRRPYYWGFALLGWAYMVISYGPLSSYLRKDLVTTLLIARLHVAPPVNSPPLVTDLWRIDHEHIELIGHSMCALLSGQAGGVLAARLGERSTAPAPPADPHTTSPTDS